MKILSLFDGISCGRVALERAGIEADDYSAFEIDIPADFELCHRKNLLKNPTISRY